MMILRTLTTGDAHGHTIVKVIERNSEDYSKSGKARFIAGCTAWKIAGGSRPTGARVKYNRKAKYYRLTPAGSLRLTLEAGGWRRTARAIALVMGENANEGSAE